MPALKQKVGNRDTKHGSLDLPVHIGGGMKKPKMRYAGGGGVRSYRSYDRHSVKDMPAHEASRVKASERAREGRVNADAQDASNRHMDILEQAASVYPKKAIGAVMRDPIVRSAGDKADAANAKAASAGKDAYLTREGKKDYQYKKGGVVRCKDGCASRGKTKGRFV